MGIFSRSTPTHPAQATIADYNTAAANRTPAPAKVECSQCCGYIDTRTGNCENCDDPRRANYLPGPTRNR